MRSQFSCIEQHDPAICAAWRPEPPLLVQSAEAPERPHLQSTLNQLIRRGQSDDYSFSTSPYSSCKSVLSSALSASKERRMYDLTVPSGMDVSVAISLWV